MNAPPPHSALPLTHLNIRERKDWSTPKLGSYIPNIFRWRCCYHFEGCSYRLWIYKKQENNGHAPIFSSNDRNVTGAGKYTLLPTMQTLHFEETISYGQISPDGIIRLHKNYRGKTWHRSYNLALHKYTHIYIYIHTHVYIHTRTNVCMYYINKNNMCIWSILFPNLHSWKNGHVK